MLLGKFITAATVSSSSPRVGDRADHTVSFDAVVPLETSDQLLVIYPKQTFPPLRTPKCWGSASLDPRRSKNRCYVVQNAVYIKQMKFLNNVKVLDVGAKLGLTIARSQNPKTGRLTSGYEVYIKDKDGYMKSQLAEDVEGMKLEMTKPAIITNFKLAPTDRR